MIESKEASNLRECVAVLAHSTTVAEVDEIMTKVGAILGLPLFGYHLDAAHPSYSAETFDKLVQRGWPVEALEMRWRGSGTILLRLRSTGSLIVIDTNRTTKDKTATAQHRALSAIHAKHGINTLLGVPVLRPGNRIATVYFAGSRTPTELGRVLNEITAKLLALGQLALDALEGPVRLGPSWEAGSLELTSREWDCLHLLTEGYRDKVIAELTGTKITTVRYHIENIVLKLNARSRTHAVAIAAKLNWLELPFNSDDQTTND